LSHFGTSIVDKYYLLLKCPVLLDQNREFLVGEKIEKCFPKLNVWIPTKDTGVDSLVTNKKDS
jgi:hypothetical protein